MNDIECPECGMEQIPAGCKMCTACEVESRSADTIAALRAQVARLRGELDDCRDQSSRAWDLLRSVAKAHRDQVAAKASLSNLQAQDSRRSRFGEERALMRQMIQSAWDGHYKAKAELARVLSEVAAAVLRETQGPSDG